MRLIQTARNSAKGIFCEYFYPSFVTFTCFYEFVKLPNREIAFGNDA